MFLHEITGACAVYLYANIVKVMLNFLGSEETRMERFRKYDLHSDVFLCCAALVSITVTRYLRKSNLETEACNSLQTHASSDHRAPNQALPLKGQHFILSPLRNA